MGIVSTQDKPGVNITPIDNGEPKSEEQENPQLENNDNIKEGEIIIVQKKEDK